MTMKLIDCPACENKVSPLSTACPRCGHPMSEVKPIIGQNEIHLPDNIPVKILLPNGRPISELDVERKKQKAVSPTQSSSPVKTKSAGTGPSEQKSKPCKTNDIPRAASAAMPAAPSQSSDGCLGPIICIVILAGIAVGISYGVRGCVDYLESQENKNVNVRIESDRRLQEAAEINQEMKFLLDELERVRRRGEKPDKVLKKIDTLNERMQRLMDK